MNILSFPSNKLNTTRNIFDILKTSVNYKQLISYDDVVFINIDSDNLHELYQNPEFYDKWFNDNKFRVAIIHDIDCNSIPFLKVADHLVFFNDIQADIVKHIVKIDIPYTVIPYPIISGTEISKKRQVLFSADFDEKLINKYLHVAHTWSSSEADDEFDIIQIENGVTTLKSNKEIKLKEYLFIAHFRLTQEQLKRNQKFFNDFCSILEDTTEKYNIMFDVSHDNSSFNSILSESEYSYIFNEELSVSKARDMIDAESSQIIYTPIRENAQLANSIAYDCKVIIAEGVSTVNLNNRPTTEGYINNLTEIITKHKESSFLHKKKLSNNISIDTLNDLNILDGNVLKNDYVFVVNFRNQSDKIERCLESIIRQNKKFDFGIAVTDDLSTDNSLELIKPLLKESNVDYILTQTTGRKYSARNLYNAVHLLVSNPESVIIEVDGDDFLNSTQVLSFIDPHYKNGYLKTFGNFVTYPVKWDEMEENTKHHNINTPWHQGKCSSWLPLRTYKKHIFDKIEIDYFLDRRDKTWLKVADDASINPRMIELVDGKIKYIEEPLYIYDTSGEEHDIGDEWSPFPAYRMLYHIITF